MILKQIYELVDGDYGYTHAQMVYVSPPDSNGNEGFHWTDMNCEVRTQLDDRDFQHLLPYDALVFRYGGEIYVHQLSIEQAQYDTRVLLENRNQAVHDFRSPRDNYMRVRPIIMTTSFQAYAELDFICGIQTRLLSVLEIKLIQTREERELCDNMYWISS